MQILLSCIIYYIFIKSNIRKSKNRLILFNIDRDKLNYHFYKFNWRKMTIFRNCKSFMSENTTIRKTIEKSILKSIVTFLASNKDFHTSMILLSKVSLIIVNNNAKSMKKICGKCNKKFDNILLFVLHL
jgi:hypothetical protein